MGSQSAGPQRKSALTVATGTKWPPGGWLERKFFGGIDPKRSCPFGNSSSNLWCEAKAETAPDFLCKSGAGQPSFTAFRHRLLPGHPGATSFIRG